MNFIFINYLLGKAHIKRVFVSGRISKRGEGVKPPEPLRKNTDLFYDLNKIDQNLMKKNEKKLHVMFRLNFFKFFFILF